MSHLLDRNETPGYASLRSERSVQTVLSFPPHYSPTQFTPLTNLIVISSSVPEQNKKRVPASHGATSMAAKPAKCISPTPPNSGATPAKGLPASSTTLNGT